MSKNWYFCIIIFCDLLWFFKNSSKINIKEKKENYLEKLVKEVICPVSRVQGAKISDFWVEGGDVNSTHSLGR